MTTRAESRPDLGASDDEPEVLDLVWRLGAGERSAIAEAYDRHGEAMRGFARRLLADEAAAEDLVQDVFLSLPQTIRRYEGRSSLRSFLIGVAVNRCRHHVRAAARYRRAKERYARSAPALEPTKPSEHHERREMAERLTRAMDTLPVEQRVAFVLAVVEGRGAAEVATLVGAPEATVRTRVMRARRKLRAALEEDGHG